MSETQWPRYQVFLQAEEGQPHMEVGSVHAPDSELALLNARDVFARRPSCISLWVAPAGVIFSLTRQQLALWQPPLAGPTGPQAEYLVLIKQKSASSAIHIGFVSAFSPDTAMAQAIRTFEFSPPPFLWWVIPSAEVLRSTPEDIPSMFSPALDKPFRLSTDFHIITAMRSARQDSNHDH